MLVLLPPLLASRSQDFLLERLLQNLLLHSRLLCSLGGLQRPLDVQVLFVLDLLRFQLFDALRIDDFPHDGKSDFLLQFAVAFFGADS